MRYFNSHALITIFSLIMLLMSSLTTAYAEPEQFNRQFIGDSNDEPITVYTAKKIITMDRANPDATAVAVRGKRIIAAGSLQSINKSLAGRKYSLNETFKSKIVLPGLIDQHLHPILGALTLSTEVISTEDWVLPDRTFKAANSQKEYLERLKTAEAALKDKKEWLFSWGYHSLWHGKLSRDILDSISSTRPIVVWQRSCHEFYLNSAAIKALGFTEEAMKGKGDASKMMDWKEGHWWEKGMNLILDPLISKFATPERMIFGLKQMVAYLHQNGVTAYMEPGALYTPDIWKLYQRILGAEDTPFYSFFIPDGRTQLDSGLSLADSLADSEKQVAMAPHGKVSFLPKQIKFFADGAIISQLMQMKDGYIDGHHGEWLITPENLRERARFYWNAGYQLHIHVNGDLGLETVVDILEGCMAQNPRANHRSVIVHFATSTEDLIARIARLGAIVSANPYYTVGFADKYSKFGLGPQRADVMVRSASVLKRNIPLSFHSDLPMGPSAPLNFAWCAVNRITPSGRVAAPEERISIDSALRAITIESAYSWQKENELGSITPGKIANFTVLEQDPYTVEPIKINNIPIWGTVFEGRLFPIKSKAVSLSGMKALHHHDDEADLHHHGDSCGVARQIALALISNMKRADK